MKYFLALLLSCSGMLLWAQPDNAKIETIDGKPVYVHTVQSGNTLWGIHRLYNVPVETIVERNPGVEGGIQEGEVIYIPVPLRQENITHKVEKGETLFGISRKYEVSVNELLEWNPEAEKGLNIGQELQIKKSSYALPSTSNNEDVKPVETPNPFGTSSENTSEDTLQSDNPFSVKVTFEDSIVEHEVLKHETFYSISKRYMVSQDELMRFNGLSSTKVKKGQILKIPLKKERITPVEIRPVPERVFPQIDTLITFKRKEVNNVAILLPFYLDRDKGYNEHVSTLATEFYMGAKLALDSLKSQGFKANVIVFDTKNDSLTIADLLNSPEFENIDLIIGPLYKKRVKQVADWCKQNHVRMVCPGNVDTDVIYENQYVYKAVPSDITLIRGLAEYTHQHHSKDKIILVKPKGKEDSILYMAFRSRFNELAAESGAKLIETTPTGFSTYLTRSSNVIIVYPTNNKSQVMKLFNEMGRFIHKTHEDKTFIFGTNEWIEFSELNGFHKNRFKLTFAAPYDLNYTYPKTMYYTQKYRDEYNADFSKMAVQGFDVTYNFCANLLMEDEVQPLIMNSFETEQMGDGNGFENTGYYILSQREYELINMALQND